MLDEGPILGWSAAFSFHQLLLSTEPKQVPRHPIHLTYPIYRHMYVLLTVSRCQVEVFIPASFQREITPRLIAGNLLVREIAAL